MVIFKHDHAAEIVAVCVNATDDHTILLNETETWRSPTGSDQSHLKRLEFLGPSNLVSSCEFQR
jgi:hypothetical protein